jgi:hypothetical protein
LSNEVWLTYGFNYKFVLQNSSGSVIGTYDNIYGIIGVQASSGTTIPAGLISLWYGSIGSVPSGWYLCDGSNGTPDLRDRFVIGAGSTYAVGATGGATSRTLTTSELPSHNHTATSVVTDPGHFHTGGAVLVGSARSAGGDTTMVAANTASAVTGITVATTNTATGFVLGATGDSTATIVPDTAGQFDAVSLVRNTCGLASIENGNLAAPNYFLPYIGEVPFKLSFEHTTSTCAKLQITLNKSGGLRYLDTNGQWQTTVQNLTIDDNDATYSTYTKDIPPYFVTGVEIFGYLKFKIVCNASG